ncbi:hypothetical protein [Fusobacterium necrophorum]|uniref:hypothetical protein n=1 Tax=Fusobacterium necrophorum TaxID=859 RepID=UPI00370F349A
MRTIEEIEHMLELQSLAFIILRDEIKKVNRSEFQRFNELDKALHGVEVGIRLLEWVLGE